MANAIKQMIPEDLTRFLKEEEWFFAPDDQIIRTVVKQWCLGRRPKENGHIGAWNTSKVTNMSFLFQCADNFNDEIGAWDVSNVTNMDGMFSSATTFNQPLEAWNVSNVVNMHGMFCGAVNFNRPLGRWNVSNVKDMATMFLGAFHFNQPLGEWIIAKKTSTSCMFCDEDNFQSSYPRRAHKVFVATKKNVVANIYKLRGN